MSNIFASPEYRAALARNSGYGSSPLDNPLLAAADAARVGRPRQQPQPQEEEPDQPESQVDPNRTYLGFARDVGLSGLAGLGNLSDLPASSVRDILTGRNPFDQWATPFSDVNRIEGRQLAREYGLAGKENNWGNFWGGIGTEIALDPLSYLGVGLLSRIAGGTGKAARAAGLAKNVKQAVNKSVARQAKNAAQAAPEVMPLTNVVDKTAAGGAKKTADELGYFAAKFRATPGALINSAENKVEALANFYRVGGTDEMLDKPIYSIASAEIPLAQWIPGIKNTRLGKTKELLSKKLVVEPVDESIKKQARDILAAEAEGAALDATGKGASSAVKKAAVIAAAQGADQVPTSQVDNVSGDVVSNTVQPQVPKSTPDTAQPQNTQNANPKLNEEDSTFRDQARQVYDSLEERYDVPSDLVDLTFDGVMAAARTRKPNGSLDISDVRSALDDMLDRRPDGVDEDGWNNILDEVNFAFNEADSIRPKTNPRATANPSPTPAAKATPDVASATPEVATTSTPSSNILDKFRDAKPAFNWKPSSVAWVGRAKGELDSLVEQGQLKVAYDNEGLAHYALPEVEMPVWLTDNADNAGSLLTKDAAKAAAKKAKAAAAKEGKSPILPGEAQGTLPSTARTVADSIDEAGKTAAQTADNIAGQQVDELASTPDDASAQSINAPTAPKKAIPKGAIKELELAVKQGDIATLSKLISKHESALDIEPWIQKSDELVAKSTQQVRQARSEISKEAELLDNLNETNQADEAATQAAKQGDIYDDIDAGADPLEALARRRKPIAKVNTPEEAIDQSTPDTGTASPKGSVAESVQQATADRDTIMSRYEKQITQRKGFSGKSQTIEVANNDGTKRTVKGTVLGDTGFAIAPDNNPAVKKGTILVHLKTGFSVTADGNITQQKVLAHMIADSGADLSFATPESMSQATREVMGNVVKAWRNSNYKELMDSAFDNFAKKVDHGTAKAATFTVDMSHIQDTSYRNKKYAERVVPLVKSLSKEVPEFSNNPVLTVNEKGNLVYRDHYQYEFSPEAILPEGVTLNQGDTVSFNLKDFGIAEKTPGQVVADSLRSIGFDVRQNKGKYVAKFQGQTVNVTGSGNDWTVSGGDGTMARQLAQRQVSGIAWSQPPISPLKQIDESNPLTQAAKGNNNVGREVQEADTVSASQGSQRPEGSGSMDRAQETGQGSLPEESGARAQAQIRGMEFKPVVVAGKIDVAQTDAAFNAISENHAQLNTRLTEMVSKGMIATGDKLFIQGFFATSDLRNVPDFNVAELGMKNLGMALGKPVKDSRAAAGAWVRNVYSGAYTMLIHSPGVTYTEKPLTVIHELAHGIFQELATKDDVLFKTAFSKVEDLIKDGTIEKYIKGVEKDPGLISNLLSSPHEVMAQMLVHISADTAQKMDPSVYDLFKSVWGKIVEYASRIIGITTNAAKDADNPINTIRDLVRYSAGFIDAGKREEILQRLNRIPGPDSAKAAPLSVSHMSAAGAGVAEMLDATREWMAKGVRSTFFKRWFGDWEGDAAKASKVVDQNGMPLTVYHGTDADFNVFNNPYADDLGGNWNMFSESPRYSDQFAAGRGANIKPAYLSIKNPLDLSGLSPRRGDVRNNLIRVLQDAGLDVQDLQQSMPYERDLHQIINRRGFRDKLAQAAQQLGYDGIKMADAVTDGADDIVSTTWVAFDPTQIKSASANVGTFDLGNPDIRYMSDAAEPVDDLHKGINDVDTAKPSDAEKENWRAAQPRNDISRNPELQAEVRKYLLGRVYRGNGPWSAYTQQDYIDAVQRIKPIKPLESVPKMATFKEMQSSLSDSEIKKGIIGLNEEIKDGTMVGTRLDIPSYQKHDTWIVTVHEPNKAGNVKGYGKAALLSDVTFTSKATAAINVALGSSKASFARMIGKWVAKDPAEIYRLAEDAMKNPDQWIQVGMNPERHSWFYIKTALNGMPAGTPVEYADQVIQVGPLVLAKKDNLKLGGKLDDSGRLVVEGEQYLTNKKDLDVGEGQVYFMSNAPQPSLKQQMAQGTKAAKSLASTVSKWIGESGNVADSLTEALDSGANMLLSMKGVRNLIALFDAPVMGATSSIKAQDESRLVYAAIEQAIQNANGAIAPLVRAIGKSKYYDTNEIRKAYNVSKDEANDIINKRAMQFRAAVEGIDSMFYKNDDLPLEIQNVVSIVRKLYRDALELEANESGLQIKALEDAFAYYSFREARKPGKRGSTRNPLSGQQYETRFHAQGGRKAFLKDLPGGTSVIDEMSIDPRVSAIVNRAPVIGQTLKSARKFPENIAYTIEKDGTKTIDPLHMTELRQYVHDNYGPKLDAGYFEKTRDTLRDMLDDNPNATWQDAWDIVRESGDEMEAPFDAANDNRYDSMIKWLSTLDPGYIRENQPIFGRNLLHDTMMRVEDGMKASYIAQLAQRLIGSELRKADSARSVADATVDDQDVAFAKTLKEFSMNTPVAHQRIINHMGEGALQEAEKMLTDRAEGLYTQIQKKLKDKTPVSADKPFTIERSPATMDGVSFKLQIRNVDGVNTLYRVEKQGDDEKLIEMGLDFLSEDANLKANTISQLATFYKQSNNLNFLNLHHLPKDLHDDITRWMKPFSSTEEIGIVRNVFDRASNIFRSNVTAPFPSFHGRNLFSAIVQNVIYRAYDPGEFGPMRYLRPMMDARKIRKDEPIEGIYDSISEHAGKAYANGFVTAKDFDDFRNSQKSLLLLQMVDAVSSGNQKLANELNDRIKQIANLSNDDPGLRDIVTSRKIADLAFKYGITGAKQGQAAEVIGDTYDSLAARMPGLDKSSALDVLRGKIPEAPPDATYFDAMKPWAAQGGMSPRGKLYEADYFLPLRAGRVVGKSIEDTVRLAPFIAYIKQGYLPEVAAEMVKHNQIDYSRLSTFERKYMRQIFPFYTYSSRILATTAKDLIQNPGGRQAQLIRTINSARDSDAMAPEYIQSSASIPLGKLPDGSDRYITGFGLGLEDAAKFGKILQGDVGGTARELFSRSNPLLKYGGELVFGRSAFYDGPDGPQQLSELDPPIGRTFSNLYDLATGERTERAKPFISQGFEHLVSNSPFARYGTFARQLTDPRKLETPMASALDLLTGVKIKDVSPAAQDSIAVQRAGMKFRELGGRNQNIPFMPEDKLDELSPKDRQDVEGIQQLLKEVKERRKARRELEEARVNEVR